MDKWNEKRTALFHASPTPIAIIDKLGTVISANSAMEKLSGYFHGSLNGKILSCIVREKRQTEWSHSLPDNTYHVHIDIPPTDSHLIRNDGLSVPVSVEYVQIRNTKNGDVAVFVKDLSNETKMMETIQHMAQHDELTGLLNRWNFRTHLSHAIARADRSKSNMALILVDLDEFKNVNDSQGHLYGDKLLVEAARRIRGIVRESDILARIGGDEFAILMMDIQDISDAVLVATKLLTVFQSPFKVENQIQYSSASIGLAFYPSDTEDSDTLLRYADLAMYQAKRVVRGSYSCFSQDLDKKIHESIKIHNRLKDAIENGALELYYQPQVGVDSGEIVGVEALLRWNDSELGAVSPAQFIPIAEATGLILPLSDWVLKQVCNQIAAWTKMGRPLRVAVNISPQQFRQPNLPEQIIHALESANAEAEWLDIEITESVAMSHPELASQHIRSLVKVGCRVALDDFGTGYSSLAYLKTLPVSKLKIDRSFIQGVPNVTGDATITRAIISLAHNMRMTLVAEGVETNEQLLFLQQNDCEIYQGWLFAKALPAAEILSLLSRQDVECETV